MDVENLFHFRDSVKIGDLIFDGNESRPTRKYAIVVEKPPHLSQPKSDGQIYYFYYFDGIVHELHWDTFTDTYKERIKVLNSLEGEK